MLRDPVLEKDRMKAAKGLGFRGFHVTVVSLAASDLETVTILRKTGISTIFPSHGDSIQVLQLRKPLKTCVNGAPTHARCEDSKTLNRQPNLQLNPTSQKNM